MIYTSVLYGFYSLSPKNPEKSSGKANREKLNNIFKVQRKGRLEKWKRMRRTGT